MEVRIGDKIRIVEMVGESDYSGRIGIVEHIDSIKQVHGTWGGLALQLERDTIEVLEYSKAYCDSFNEAIENLYSVDWSETDGSDVKEILQIYLKDGIRKNKDLWLELLEKRSDLNKFQKQLIAKYLNK